MEHDARVTFERIGRHSSERVLRRTLSGGGEVGPSLRAVGGQLREARARIIGRARLSLDTTRLPRRLIAALHEALDELDQTAAIVPYLPPIDYVFAAASALGGTGRVDAVAEACLHYYLGLHLLDDVHDCELHGRMSVTDATLAATVLYATMPARVLSESADDDAHRQAALCFPAHLMRSCGGQFLDTDRNEPITLDLAGRVLRRRTGAIGALFGAATATALGEPRERVAVASRAVEQLYMCTQVADDVANVFGRPVSSDIENGARSILFAFARAQLPRDALAELDAIVGDPAAAERHDVVRALLRRVGAPVFAVGTATLLRARAAQQLAMLAGSAATPEIAYVLATTDPQ